MANFRPYLLFALILPLVVFSGLIAYNFKQFSGAGFTLPVQGYDPRDLLRGHYMLVRINATDLAYLQNKWHDDPASVCYCLKSPLDTPAVTPTEIPCAEAQKSCAITLNRLDRDGLNPLQRSYEIFVDESRAVELESEFRANPGRFRLDVAVKNRNLIVRGLTRDGELVSGNIR